MNKISFFVLILSLMMSIYAQENSFENWKEKIKKVNKYNYEKIFDEVLLLPDNEKLAALPEIAKILSHKDGFVRYGAIKIILKLDTFTNEMIDPLTHIVKTDEDYVSTKAATCLAFFGSRASVAVDTIIAQYHQRSDYLYILALGKIGAPTEKILPFLQKLIYSRDDVHAIIALGDLGAAAIPALDDLIKVVKKNENKDTSVSTIPYGRCVLAIKTISKMGDISIPYLVSFLKSRDWLVQLSALSQLKTFNEQASSAIPFLIELLEHREREIREEVSQTLVAIGKVSIPSLLRVVENPDDKRYVHAIEILAELKEEEFIDKLITLFESDLPLEKRYHHLHLFAKLAKSGEHIFKKFLGLKFKDDIVLEVYQKKDPEVVQFLQKCFSECERQDIIVHLDVRPSIPEETKTVIAKALSFLLSEQNENGSWSGNIEHKVGNEMHIIHSSREHVGLTALASLALLESKVYEEQMGNRNYDREIDKAVTFLLRLQTSTGFIGKDSTRLISHALATQLLAKYYLVKRDPRIKDALRKAIDFIAHWQNADGSWYYAPHGFYKSIVQNNIIVTVQQLEALLYARQVGFYYPKTVQKAKSYLNSIRAKDAYFYSIYYLVEKTGLGAFSLNLLRQIENEDIPYELYLSLLRLQQDFVWEDIKEEYYFWEEIYAVTKMFSLWEKITKCDSPKKEIEAELIKIQTAKGTWDHKRGSIYATAYSIRFLLSSYQPAEITYPPIENIPDIALPNTLKLPDILFSSADKTKEWPTVGGNLLRNRQIPKQDLSFTFKWKQQVLPQIEYQLHNFSSEPDLVFYPDYIPPRFIPAISDNMVFINNGISVQALAVKDGKALWNWQGLSKETLPKYLNYSHSYATTVYEQAVYANVIADSPHVQTESVFSSYLTRYFIPRRAMVSLSAKTGEMKWVSKTNDVSFLATPVVKDNIAYTIAYDWQTVCNFYLIALNATTGEEKWRLWLDSAILDINIFGFPAREPIVTELVVWGDQIYFASNMGSVVAATTSGKVLWKFTYPTNPKIAKFSDKRKLEQSKYRFSQWQNPQMLATKSGILLVPFDNKALYCLSYLDGNLLWKQEITGEFRCFVAVNDTHVFVGEQQSLQQISLVSGELREEYQTFASGKGLICGDILYFPAYDEIKKWNIETQNFEVSLKTEYANWQNIIAIDGKVFLTNDHNIFVYDSN